MLGSARDEAAPLLGRAEEQSLLTSLLDGIEERGQALVLRGEPGIGKSRLMSVAAQAARDRGMTVLTATGVQSEAHLPFAGLHQLLRPVRERAVELPPIQRDALDAAFGLTHDVAPEHFRIAMASLDLVSEVANDAPLLLVVEGAGNGWEFEEGERVTGGLAKHAVACGEWKARRCCVEQSCGRRVVKTGKPVLRQAHIGKARGVPIARGGQQENRV